AAPDLWRELLDISTEAAKRGARVFPQVAGRPFGMLLGLQTDINPFGSSPTFASLAPLPLAERVARLRDPEIKKRILAECAAEPSMFYAQFGRIFQMGSPPNYEPGYEESIEAIAKASGRDPAEYLYDCMLEREGRELFLVPVLNYSTLSADPIREMMFHPNAVLGLGDGGAHCGIICDASIQTFMLTHWVRDRSRGERIPLEFAIQRMTSDPARLYGLCDRGVLAPGFRGDLNIIDLDGLRLEAPEMIFDLPAGGKRFMQRARGYRATVVAGEVTLENDEFTGALPGRLIRGARSAPSAV
ncbi:MAG TPA: D-aminoacylase, partial [Deltaproteobacteria bacterium]|nr:D-aminoacylase [Deltaproteobacteria bacterium]